MASARSRVLVLTTLYRAVRIAMHPGGPSLGSRLAALPRLISQTVSGRYAGLTAGRLALMAGALAYIVSPIDLIPEGMLMFAGLLDDAMVMSWLAAALVTETESFLAWEGEGRSVPEGAAALVIPGEVTATS